MNYSRERYRFRFGPSMTPAVKYLIFVNIGVFILQNIFGPAMTYYLGLVPRMLFSNFAIWQLGTYLFLHGGIFHLFINMLVLWMFGAEIERHWGSREFLKYYFVCGIGAGFIQVLFNAFIFPSNFDIPVVGASGAVYGLLLAFALMFPDREIFLLIFFVLPVQIRAKYLAMIFAGISLFSGVFGADNGVAHFAHLGGMLVGLLYLKVDWRWDQATSWFHRKRASRQIVREAKRRQQQLRLRESVDALLDKINEVGYENLTDEEKDLLKRASQHLSREEES